MNKIKTKLLLLSLTLPVTFLLMAQKTDSVNSGVYAWNQLQAKKEKTSITRHIFTGSTLDLSYFEMHTTTLQPGKAPHPAHTHGDTEELIIVKQGIVKITINGHSTILGPSGVAVIMPGDEHGIENAEKNDATYYIVKMKSKYATTGSVQQKQVVPLLLTGILLQSIKLIRAATVIFSIELLPSLQDLICMQPRLMQGR